MRTLSSTLLAAQKHPQSLPYIEVEIRDFEAGIKRLTWTRLYTGSEPDNHHGIAFDGQGSMHRIRAGPTNTLHYQKVTNPGAGSNFGQWTQIASDCAGPCAIAAYGAKIYIFYRRTDNTLRKYYSHDYGQNWTNAQLVAYTDVSHLAAAWWGTTDIVVCLAFKAAIPARINAIILDTSNQGTTQNEWSDGTHPIIENLGIGATYDPFYPGINIVLAGRESDTPYNHYDLFRTNLYKIGASYYFFSLESFISAPQGENITYEYPDCHLPASAQAHETTRVLAVEKYTGTTAYTRPLTCHRVKGTAWGDTTFTEPKPFLNISPTHGLRMSSTSTHLWLSIPSGVWRATRAVDTPLTLTTDAARGRIVAVTQRSHTTTQPQPALTITLDNSQGRFASPGQGELASLRFRAELTLCLGYKTTAGPETSEAGTYWIDAWEWASSPNQSLFTIHALDGWGLMDRWSARYQMRWNKDDVNPLSVWHILYQLVARVGICLTNTPTKPQSSAINNFYPDFTLEPGVSGDTALKRLLAFVPDQLVFRGQEAFTKNPLADETPSYAYGTDHPILAGEYSHAVPYTRVRAIGRDASNNRIVRDAFDWDLVALAIDVLEQDYDPNLQTATRAQERADGLLRKHALEARGSQITVPTNVGQELVDVVTLTDPRCGVSQTNHRIITIQTHYHHQSIYIQRLVLCAP